jgi:L-amino acid N-acyltransferase YncA
MSASIRKGTAEDLPGVLKLIRELADYERAAGEVEVSLEEMKNWGFEKDKLFDFFVLEAQGNIIGLALYYYKYSTWKGKCLFLEDLIVTEKERKKGYGKLLFNAVAKEAKAQKVRRMEWQVLDWNAPAINFYKAYSAHLDPEWINCKLNYVQLQAID